MINASVYLVDTFIVPVMEHVVIPAMQTAYTYQNNIALWVESQATAHYSARIGKIVYNTIMALPVAAMLFALPPWLVNGGMLSYTVVRVCTDYYTGSEASLVLEPLIGMHFLLSAVAHLGLSILQNGNPHLAISAAIRAFIGITYFPIH
jgi:hypothetical protein